MSGHLLHDDALVHRISAAAAAATSIHHTQPCRLQMAGPDIVELHYDLDRVLWIADPKGRALRLSCGAALFNVRLALRQSGFRTLVTPSQDPVGSPTLIASVQLAPGQPATMAEQENFRALRAPHPRTVPSGWRSSDTALAVAEQEAAHEGATLRVLAAWEMTLVSRMIAAAADELAANREYCAELASWAGGPAGSLDLTAPHPSGPVDRHLAVLSTAWDRTDDWLRAGQGLQRVLLTAARYGLATSLFYQPIELQDIRPCDAWWPWPEWPQMIIGCS